MDRAITPLPSPYCTSNLKPNIFSEVYYINVTGRGIIQEMDRIKKILSFIAENPYVLMLAGFLIIAGDVLTAQYLLAKGMSGILVWVIGGIGVLLYIAGRVLVLLRKNRKKRR